MNSHDNVSLGSSPSLPPPLPSSRSRANASAGTAAHPPDLRPSSTHHSTPPLPSPRLTPARSDAPLPAGIRGWCWGGFLLNCVWAIRFRVWWGLLALVPLLGLPVSIWLGIKGRELAWRRRPWTSVQAFNEAQRKWSIGGLVLWVVACVLYGGGFAYQEWHSYRAKATAENPGLTQNRIGQANASPAAIKLSAASASAPKQVVPPVRGEIGVDDEMPDWIKTNYGTLDRRKLPDQSSAIFLNGHQLFNGYDANWHELVRGFRRSNGTDVVLLSSSGGRGNSCETLYFFVVVNRDGIQYSPEFGSCTPVADYEQRGDTITLTMPRMGGMSAYQFGPDNKLLEDGKPVLMDDSVDPSR